jgi:hypothetical protein
MKALRAIDMRHVRRFSRRNRDFPRGSKSFFQKIALKTETIDFERILINKGSAGGFPHGE